MRTLHDFYMDDEVTGHSRGYTFEEWLDSLVDGGYALACCKTGVLFCITPEQKDQVKPDDPCICKEYVQVMEGSTKTSIKHFGMDALVGLQLTLNSRPFNFGQSIYS